MILLTPDLRARLLANGRRRGVAPVPLAKFFNPLGAATWLMTAEVNGMRVPRRSGGEASEIEGCAGFRDGLVAERESIGARRGDNQP